MNHRVKEYLIILSIGIIFLVFPSVSFSSFERNKQKIDTTLEQKIFSTLHRKQIDILKSKIEMLNASKYTSPQLIKYLQKAFTKKYNELSGVPQTLKIQPDYTSTRIQIPTLMFHYIENVPANTKDKMRYSLSYSPKKLEDLLIYFQENNIETLTFWDVKHILEGQKKMPNKAVILTFDDGHVDHYKKAFPLLKKYHSKGVFFIISEKPNNDWNFMNWSQIQELEKYGNEIAGHTKTHANLLQLYLPAIKHEVLESKKEIEQHIRKSIISFSYPYGKNNKAIRDVVKDNYLFARTTKKSKYFSTNDLYSIPTIHMTPYTSLEKIKSYY